ncbi:MAG: RNA polymerase sigma factor [Thermogutta sp.]
MTKQTSESERHLIARVRAGDSEGWEEIIRRYEGRLYSYFSHHVKNRQTAEDLVQETFVGFLVSLPHYDARRSLENWLFSIAAHKLTDHYRRLGRRAVIALENGDDPTASQAVGGRRQRGPSTVAASHERRSIEEHALCQAIAEQISLWKASREWLKVSCMELLFLRGWGNNRAAQFLNIDEQQVANWKFDFLRRLRERLRAQGLPHEVFPELQSDAP